MRDNLLCEQDYKPPKVLFFLNQYDRKRGFEHFFITMQLTLLVRQLRGDMIINL